MTKTSQRFSSSVDRRISFAAIFGKSWRLLKSRKSFFIALALTLSGVSTLASLLATLLRSGVATVILDACVGGVSAAAVAVGVFNVRKDGTATMAQCLRAVFMRAIPLAFLSVTLYALALLPVLYHILAGVALDDIPLSLTLAMCATAIVITAVTFLATPCLMAENRSPLACVKRSRILMRKRWRFAIGILLLCLLAAIIPTSLQEFLLGKLGAGAMTIKAADKFLTHFILCFTDVFAATLYAERCKQVDGQLHNDISNLFD